MRENFREKKIQNKILGQRILREILVERFLWEKFGEKVRWKTKLGEKMPESKKMMKNFCLKKQRKGFSERNFQEKKFPNFFFGETLRKKSW